MPTKKSEKTVGEAILFLVINQVVFDFKNYVHALFLKYILKSKDKSNC